MNNKTDTSAPTSGSARPVAGVEQVRAERSNSPFRALVPAAELREVITWLQAEARKQQEALPRVYGTRETRAFYDGELFALGKILEAITAWEAKQARARNSQLNQPGL